MMETAPDKPKILVMDDDEDVRFIAEIILNRLGFSTVFAESGTEAVDLYKKGNRFHAVILDLNIPGGMGGEEAVNSIIDLDPEARVFASCGNPYDPVMENPAGYGFKGAIPKPFLVEHLQTLLSL